MSDRKAWGDRTGKLRDRMRILVKDLTGGVEASEVRRLFEREAPQAYAVLTRDQAEAEELGDGLQGLWKRTRLLYHGLASKLTPPRRLLFAASVVAAVLGLIGIRLTIRGSEGTVVLDSQPFWFLAAILGLLFLLALELVDRVRVRDELEVAQDLQRGLLPSEVTPPPGYGVAHSYRMANEVGGDYYDLHPLADGRFAIIIGDASGHGMAAGLLMAISNATLETALDLDPSPRQVAELLNRALLRTGGRRAFMSLFYGLLTPETGHLEYICCGHPFPYLRRAGGEVVELGSGGFPLGLRGEVGSRSAEVTLAPGDLLVLYTDGLPEGVSAAGEAFGFKRLGGLVTQGGPAEALHRRLTEAFDGHRGEAPLNDDLTLVVLEWVAPLPESPPPPLSPPSRDS
jgi:hypothetical protein